MAGAESVRALSFELREERVCAPITVVVPGTDAPPVKAPIDGPAGVLTAALWRSSSDGRGGSLGRSG
jgi:hypothetical protein